MNANEDPRDKPHWRLYGKLCRDHPELIRSLEEAIDEYVSDLDEFNSSEAGKEILSKWPDRGEWKRLTGNLSRELFGAAVYDALKDDWSIREDAVRGKKVKVYERNQPKGGHLLPDEWASEQDGQEDE